MKKNYESPEVEIFSFTVREAVMDSTCTTYTCGTYSCPDGICVLDGCQMDTPLSTF